MIPLLACNHMTIEAMLCDVKHNRVGGGMASPIVVMGVSGLRQIDRWRGIGSAPAGAVRRRRRLPSGRQHRQDDRRSCRSTTTTVTRGWRRSASGWPSMRDGGVMSCSALKRIYRDQLRAPLPRASLPASAWHAGGHRHAGRPAGPATSCPPRCWHPNSKRSNRSKLMSTASRIDVDQNIDSIVEDYYRCNRQENR